MVVLLGTAVFERDLNNLILSDRLYTSLESLCDHRRSPSFLSESFMAYSVATSVEDYLVVKIEQLVLCYLDFRQLLIDIRASESREQPCSYARCFNVANSSSLSNT